MLDTVKTVDDVNILKSVGFLVDSIGFLVDSIGFSLVVTLTLPQLAKDSAKTVSPKYILYFHKIIIPLNIFLYFEDLNNPQPLPLIFKLTPETAISPKLITIRFLPLKNLTKEAAG